jgi:hypothetical protein
MAKYNEILVGRYNRFLTKLFSMKGPAPAPQLAGEIAPNIQLFNGAENRYLENWNRFIIVASTGVPAAGNRAAVRIRMNAGSGVIAVLEKLSVVKNTTTSTPVLLVDSVATVMPTESVTNQGARSLDARQQQTNSNAIVSISINFGLLGTQGFLLPSTSSVAYEMITFEDQELPLSPGTQITVADDILADGFTASLMWRERPIEDSEKAS